MHTKLKTTILLAALSAAPALAGELNIAHYSSTIDLGYGYNPVLGQVYTPCVIPTRNDGPADPSMENYRESYKIKEVTSTNDLRTSIGVSAYAAAFTPTASFDASFQKLMQTQLSSEKSYFYVSVHVSGIPKTLKLPFRLSDGALKILEQGESAFKSACGDSYVSQLVGGGEFSALITMDKLTSSETSSFYAQVDAATKNLVNGGKIGADGRTYFSKLAAEKNTVIDIQISGQTGEDLPSLTDVGTFLESARTFASKLKSPQGKPSPVTAVYAPYDNSVEFREALLRAKKTRYANFSASSTYMDEIVTAFDKATDGLVQIREALDNPDAFQTLPAEADLERLQETYTAKRDAFAKLASACAQNSANGVVCAAPGNLTLPPLRGFVRGALCNLDLFLSEHGSAGETCTAVVRDGHACYCSACTLFRNDSYPIDSGAGAQDVCVGMKPNAQLNLRFAGRVRVDSNPHDSWLGIRLNGTYLINRANIIGDSEVVTTWNTQASPNGEFAADYNVERCQSNRLQFDRCTTTPLDPSKGLVRIQAK